MRPAGLLHDLERAPSSGVPAVASSKQKDSASGTTPASRPTRRRTTATRAVRAFEHRGHDALGDGQIVQAHTVQTTTTVANAPTAAAP